MDTERKKLIKYNKDYNLEEANKHNKDLQSGRSKMRNKVYSVFLNVFLSLTIRLYLYNAEAGFVYGEFNLVTKQEAVDACENAGKSLVGHSEIMANPTAFEYTTEIRHGESAWINGFVVFSSFLAWEGCYELDGKFATAHHLESHSLFECIIRCRAEMMRNGNIQYVGLSHSTCYCLNDTSIYPLPVVNGLPCDIKCSHSKSKSCGGHNVVNLFRVYQEIPLRWAQNEPSSKQCVYVRKKVKTYEAYTASCYSVTPNVNAYFCTNNTSLRQNNKCVSNYTRNCERDKASARQNAFEDCFNNQGTLSGLYNGIHALVENRTYWLGEYRTFQLSETTGDENSACLAVTNVDNKLYLDPDSCSAKKKYICKGNNYVSNRNSLVTLIILLSASVLVIAVLLIVIFIMCYKKRKVHINENNSHDVYEEIQERDDQDRYAILQQTNSHPSCQQADSHDIYYLHPSNSSDETHHGNSEDNFASRDDFYDQLDSPLDCSELLEERTSKSYSSILDDKHYFHTNDSMEDYYIHAHHENTRI